MYARAQDAKVTGCIQAWCQNVWVTSIRDAGIQVWRLRVAGEVAAAVVELVAGVADGASPHLPQLRPLQGMVPVRPLIYV